MTYAEVKNQFTTVESINTRLKEIKNLTQEYMNKRDKLNDKHFDIIKKFISDNLASDYELTSLTPRSMTLNIPNDTFYRVEFWFEYEIEDWNNLNNQIWKFEMSISSCGNFSVNNNDKKSAKVFNYYNTIASIISNVEFRTKLEEVVKNYVDENEEIKKEYRDLRSEEQQLNILKKNMIEEQTYGEMLLKVMKAEDKTQLVVVKKNVEENEADGIRKGGEFIKVMTEPMPNSPETRPEVDKKLKEISKSNEGKFTLTQIRFIKFNK